MHVHMDMCLYHAYIITYVCAWTCMYAYTHVCICLCTCVYAYAHMCMSVHVCMYMYTHVCICMHMCIACTYMHGFCAYPISHTKHIAKV